VALENKGHDRESANMLLGFAGACPDAGGELSHAGETLYSLGDFQAARDVTERLVRMRPDSASALYLQARASQGLGHFDEALEAYAASVQLAGDVKRVKSEVFMKMASSYASLGRFCEAMTPVQTYITADSGKRDVEALRRIISDYARQGNCSQTYAAGVERLPRQSNGVVTAKAVVNGVTGTFVVDTGASFVSVTRDFAKRAKLDALNTHAATLQTANGTVDASLATISNIRLGHVHADAVPAVILEKSLGPGVDGLLGMSFLARFDVALGDKEWNIKAKTTK
jgi:aspartyl protease family protein